MGKGETVRSGPAVAIVVSRYNATVTDALLAGALRAFRRAGGSGTPDVFHAAGSFELPLLAHAAAASGRYAAVVALGCLIRGETRHDRHIADAVAQGLTRVALDTGVPIGLGVLTVNTPAQARARAGGKLGNRGEDAMHAALASAAALARLRGGPGSFVLVGGSGSSGGSADKARRRTR